MNYFQEEILYYLLSYYNMKNSYWHEIFFYSIVISINILEFMAKENNYIISQILIQANDFFIDHFQIIKSYIDDSLVSSIHSNAIHIPNIFRSSKEKERGKKENKWKFAPLLTQLRGSTFEIFFMLDIKKKGWNIKD